MGAQQKYATEEERRQARLEARRRHHASVKADPTLYAQVLAKRREQRADRNAKPKPINAALYRARGVFAPLFALQAAV